MDDRRRIGWFTYWRGRYRLLWGWCPICYSSPPRPTCPVCGGDHEYGPTRITAARRALWRARLDRLRRRG